MKRFVMVSLCGLSILAFAAAGYGWQLYELEKGQFIRPLYTMQPGNYQELVVGEKPPILEFKASGAIDAVSEYKQNVQQCAPGPWSGQANLFGMSPQYVNGTGNITSGGLAGVQKGAAFNKTESYMETRARLRFDALMGKQVSGTFFFEIDATRWGEKWTTGAQRNNAGDWNADSASVEVKNAYLTFALPPVIPVPITINAGIIPLVTRPVVQYTDGSGMQMLIKPDPVEIRLQWMKALEGEDWASDDCDVYHIQAKVNVGGLTVAGWMSYYNMNTYPFNVSAPNVYSSLPSPPYTNPGNVVNPVVNQTADMSWWGLYVDGKVGPFYINTDFVYDWGKVNPHENADVPNPDGTNKKVKYSGWITRLALDYPWERFNIGGVFMYASGSDLKKTSANGYAGDPVAYGPAGIYGYTRKVSGYIVPPNAEHVYDDEDLVIFGTGANGINRANTGDQNGGTGGSSVGRGGYGGTWFAKLYANFKPTPWYRITLVGMYIGDTTKNGNTLGNAVTYAGTPRDDKEIGWEANLINDIQIYKNLQFRAGVGYLWAGKAFDQVERRYGWTGCTNVSPNNPWAIVTKLLYVF
jgi:hypothetical protein